MILEYARTDHMHEIERKAIIESICNSFDNVGQYKIIFSLFGNSGVGKSYICKSIYNSDLVVPEKNKVLIDFNHIVNNNMPVIIQTIIAKFGYGRFYDTQIQLDKYFKSVDASKSEFLAKCVDVFIDELNRYANDYGRVLLIFDTFESLSVNTKKTGFEQILNTTNNNISFLIAGITKVDFCICTTHHVSGFNEKEIKEFLISRNPRMKTVFKKHGSLLLTQIRKYTDDGNPILCGLVSDWLLHCHDLNTQIDYMLSSKEISRRHLINWISELDNDLYITIKITAFFNDRMTTRLLSSMSDMNDLQSKTCLLKMTDFSFIKFFSEELDSDPQIVLHDIVAKLIRKYFPFPQDQLCSLAKKAVIIYDQMILEDRTNNETFSLEQSLRVEKVMCMVRNGQYDDALVMFDNEILDGIDVFDYGFVNQLINELENYLNTYSDEFITQTKKDDKLKWEYVLQIAKAEVELSKYCAEEAVAIYEELKKNPLYNVPLYKVLAEDVFARALINPCTLNRNETPLDAIKIIKWAINCFVTSNLNRRTVKSYYWLGNAYVRSGQNDKAQVAYDFALSQSQTDIQKVMILLDMSKMLRLQQDVNKALEPLQKCDILMENLKKNKGKYYYYKGNVYRDLDDIETATIYYDKAFKALIDGDDIFTLCELNLDFAWLQYIRDDTEEINITEVEKYLNEGWKYAIKYQFGAEYSEYYHILYEIQNYLEDYTNAYQNLDQAINFAYQYSNIYMILDCLNHLAQRYYHEKKYDDIPGVIQEMEKIEKSGCKIRVFRGRAKLVQADIYFDRGNYEHAIKEYFDGFVIVALYGNSRTNVELFHDLYNKKGSSTLSRKEKMMECLSHISEPDKYCRKFRNTWSRKKISQEYKYFLDNFKKN